MTDFSRRWAVASAQRSQLCLGIAPSSTWLSRWSLPDNVDGAQAYCKLVLSASTENVAAFKVQVPFFFRFGAAGMDLLRQFIADAHAQGSLVVLDAKLGDADDTMRSYADLYLGPESQLRADAVTAVAFMGTPSLHPLLTMAAERRAAVFVLVRTSNHAAEDVQTCLTADGRTTAQAIADALTEWNRVHCSDTATGVACAVVGARLPESAELISRLPYSLLEIPGLGRADRRTDEVLECVKAAPQRALVTVTTGILQHGPEIPALQASIDSWRAEISRHLA